MNKILILIITFIGITEIVCSQNDFQKRHIYGLTDDFYYLEIKSDYSYKLKIGMYGNHYIKGSYMLINDTLELASLEYPNDDFKISKEKIDFIKNSLSKYMIFDSLLIPLNYEFNGIYSNYLNIDTNYISNYIQTDLHSYFRISLKKDSTFFYVTGTDRDNYTTQGNWIIRDSFLILKPNECDNLLHWICTDYKFRIIENFIVGKTYSEEDDMTEYQYLRK